MWTEEVIFFFLTFGDGVDVTTQVNVAFSPGQVLTDLGLPSTTGGSVE